MAAALTGLALAGTLVVGASPAQAACRSDFRWSLEYGQFSVVNRFVCWDPDYEKDRDIVIEKWMHPSTLDTHYDWVIVAKGSGSLCIPCSGLPNKYRINGGQPINIVC